VNLDRSAKSNEEPPRESVALKVADHFTPKSDRMGKAWSASLPGRTLSSLAKRTNSPSEGSLLPFSK